MIEPETRKAVYALHERGVSIRDISRNLRIDRKTVRVIIRQQGAVSRRIRRDKVQVDRDLLARLHRECEGYVQRIHEKLEEEEGIKVGYSTLVRLIRRLGIGVRESGPCGRVPDEPGAEMQHDTSPYERKIGGKDTRVIASLLYFRYCKLRYLKFYRSFNRFCMKYFLHEALTFFGYAAKICIIDNTNLARLRGTGKHAVMAPEMEQFGKRYGFEFVCHEAGHCNRKAGEERGFYTVETNFFPGRTFESLEDMNRQAIAWATVKMANRPVAKTGLIPARAFEHEQAYLGKLPPYMPPPYLQCERGVDQYGYIPFDANYYFVPGASRGKVTVLRYSDSIKLYRERELTAEYELPAWGVKNVLFSPPGMPKPAYQPKNRRKPTELEEKRLKGIAPEVADYIDSPGVRAKGNARHGFIRELFALSKRTTGGLFVKTLSRALHYGITDMAAIERIAVLLMKDGLYAMPQIEADETFREREAYIEGRITDAPDLSAYDKILEDEND